MFFSTCANLMYFIEICTCAGFHLFLKIRCFYNMCEITIFLEIGKIWVFGKKVKIGENGENR